ncbi:transglutaminase TgpA family protein [Aeromicrobium stalagmiti]|uniref:transglutaminase TgpA family protein n=1 Tax=Aeromicrobium stalagmiti TaxID=2738988 RepID=UPI0015698B7B|nr:DUF3488 and transglutaminase-like domain-containing protein [Aeromicrobium stalagmiti]NRQ51314.1 transglutaminase domain-containing protein [Aeromicrobium stalagmiti]
MLRADPHPRTPSRTAGETWFDHAVIAVALFLLLVGFGTVIAGNDWRVTTMLIALMTGATCAVLRGLGLRLVAPFAVVVELIAITWIFVPETLVSIIPTGETVRGLADLGRSAREIIVEEQAPVGAARPIVLVVAASFGLIVIVADVLLQRRRAVPLVGILLLAVFVTPALISGETPAVWLFVSVAALWLVLLRSRTATTGQTRRGAVPALVVGAAALVGAVGFPAVSPDVSAVAASWGKPPPTVFGRGINPMLELGQNLRRNSTVQALTYTTTADTAQYLKVATLRDFTGTTWAPTRTRRFDPFEGESTLREDIDREQTSTTISIKGLRSTFLPVPYPSLIDVRGLQGEWRFQRAGLTLMSEQDDSRGETYTVRSLDVQPTAEQLRAIDTTVGPQLESYVELPADMPQVIRDTALEVTADADNDYDRVQALQNWFRSNGGFTYSETAPAADDYDGNGVDVIAKFLEVKAGYCVHFSSAMAVMARSLGIPARIAIGYAPGAVIGDKDGETEYEATSDDLHAWTEVYFQGVGWTRFDPTTSVGSSTVFEEPAAAVPESTPEDEAAPNQPDRSQQNQIDSAPAPTTDEPQTAPRTALITFGALLVLGAAPWLVRASRRRWRLARGHTGVEPLWAELEDVTRDFRIPASAADTPRGFAGRLRDRDGVDAEALERLLRRVEATRFARDAQLEGDGVADLIAVVSSIRAGSGTLERVRAALLPRSLGGPARVTRLPDTGRLAT